MHQRRAAHPELYDQMTESGRTFFDFGFSVIWMPANAGVAASSTAAASPAVFAATCCLSPAGRHAV